MWFTVIDFDMPEKVDIYCFSDIAEVIIEDNLVPIYLLSQNAYERGQYLFREQISKPLMIRIHLRLSHTPLNESILSFNVITEMASTDVDAEIVPGVDMNCAAFRSMMANEIYNVFVAMQLKAPIGQSIDPATEALPQAETLLSAESKTKRKPRVGNYSSQF
jgi:hypothetical protein